jgi:hypothetical protein
LTRIIVAYQPCGTRKRKMMGEPVWDQNLRYFEARGEIRDPRVMFRHNLISLLCQRKAAGDKVLLMGDFNKIVYSGPIALALSEDELRLSKICCRTTEETLPPTHARGRFPIDVIFGTVGLVCTAAFLLPERAGVGNHGVFVADLTSELVLGDALLQVIPITSRLLNCTSDKIKHSYTLLNQLSNRHLIFKALLNQLSNRHLIFKKLLWIDNASDHISPDKVQLCKNRVDLELEHFMKLAEEDSHKYKRNNIDWFPYVGVWIHCWWLFSWVHPVLQAGLRPPATFFVSVGTAA